ncbi:MAG TPA: glycosyltransferase [Sphingobacteriaceae bacterium]
MRKKVFFILPSLTAGGSERVYWLLSQNLNKDEYDVTIVLLDSTRSFFSHEIAGVRIIDLGTIKASRSVFKLYSLLKKERPYAIFSTGGHINMLVGFVSMFIDVPHLIARPTNVAEKSRFSTRKAKLFGSVGIQFYSRFDKVVCQSDEIRTSVGNSLNLSPDQLVVIPNPVIPTTKVKSRTSHQAIKRLIVVARLTRQKGLERLIDVINDLPRNYTLTIAGAGPLRDELDNRIRRLSLQNRVNLVGLVTNVTDLIAEHDLFVLPSFIEGFPNVVVEALSVGTPVVAFKVGGISQIITDGFNGYITTQNDLKAFSDNIVRACGRYWDPVTIKDDVNARFGIEKIVSNYESLLA